jgi:hypothetical protein
MFDRIADVHYIYKKEALLISLNEMSNFPILQVFMNNYFDEMA